MLVCIEGNRRRCMVSNAQLKSRIIELERALEDEKKPRIAAGENRWSTGYVDLSVTPYDLDEDLHPDVREYKRVEYLLKDARDECVEARNNFNKAADLLDKAVLCILRNDASDDDNVLGRYRELMSSLLGKL
jgi:hypothetical protein